MKKKLIFLHKYLSIIIFLPLIIVSLSGSILVYKYEIDNLILSNVLSIKKDKIMPLDILEKNVKKSYPNYEIVGWLMKENDKLAHQIYLIKHNEKTKNLLYINQYTGELLNELKENNEYFTGFIDSLHTSLFLGERGVLLLTFMGLIFCIVAISGILIYKNFWFNIIRLRFDKSMQIYTKDMHKMIGIISSPILLIIAITGTYWTFNSSLKVYKKEDVYIVKPYLYNQNISLDSLYKKVTKQIGKNTLHYISFPYTEKRTLTFYVKENSTNILYDQYANVVKFNKDNGEIISTYKIKEENLKSKFINTFRKAHYGYYNSFTKLLWFLTGLTPLILSVTGIMLVLSHEKIIPKNRLKAKNINKNSSVTRKK